MGPRAPLPLAGARATVVTPRRLVPVEHFALAFVWLAIAVAGLVRVSPALAAGAFTAPEVVAVTHALTLGLVLTSIIGALQQIAPAAMGVPARREWLAHVAFALTGIGTLAVVAGAWRWAPPLIGAGWTAVALAVGVTYWNLVRHLARAVRAPNAAHAVHTGFLCLGGALAVAFARVGNALGWWQLSPHALLVAHVHLALGGFATVVAMGVGSHVLPAFLMSRNVPVRTATFAWRATAAGSIVVAAGALTDAFALQALGAAAMAAGVVSWLAFGGAVFLRRERRAVDPSLVLIVAAHVSLAASCVAGLWLLADSGPRAATVYVALALVGWLGLFISGMAARILPMLTGKHRESVRAAAGSPRTTASELVQHFLLRTAVAMLILGATLLPVAIGSGNASAVRLAAFVEAAAVALLLLEHVATRAIASRR